MSDNARRGKKGRTKEILEKKEMTFPAAQGDSRKEVCTFATELAEWHIKQWRERTLDWLRREEPKDSVKSGAARERETDDQREQQECGG